MNFFIMFGRKKKEKEENRETITEKNFEELKREISPEGLEEYRVKGKSEEWEKKLYIPRLRAVARRLLNGEKWWFGEWEDEKIRELLDALMRTYMQVPNKRVLYYERPGEIVMHPLLKEWVNSKYVVLRRADRYGVPVVLEVVDEEKRREEELYIGIHPDIAEIGLAIPKDQLTNFERTGARCNYIISKYKKDAISSEDIKV